jgi:hypothetical protein
MVLVVRKAATTYDEEEPPRDPLVGHLGVGGELGAQEDHEHHEELPPHLRPQARGSHAENIEEKNTAVIQAGARASFARMPLGHANVDCAH